MAYTYLVPKWFFGYDIVMEFIFTLITLAVAYYSFKVYNISKQKSSKLFGIAFSFISASYFIWLLINLFLLKEISEGVESVSINEIISASLIGLFSYMILYLIGLSLLFYITLKIKNKKVYFIVLTISIIGLILSANKIIAFHLISSIFLIFILSFYFKEYFINKNKKVFLVFLAFIFILITSFNFIFVVKNYYAYVAGHISTLAGYILILINLLSIKKYEQKKK